jgi:hypothetical protein
MTDDNGTVARWTPPPRPDWLLRVNAEGGPMAIESLVPLEAEELLATAQRNTGFSDFGSDEWREGFDVLINAINTEAELHLFGRLMTRNDLLRWLEARLGIEAAYKAHPEIEDEQIEAPLIITGLPRSGTSILFEILAQDNQFGSPRNWEILFPYPPPERASYATDPRIERAQQLVTQWSRVAPTYATMHEMGANIPNECIVAMSCTFRTENLSALFQIPSYNAWLYRSDLTHAYRYYKRMLKLLQWRNPRRHWLLKAPSHLGNLPILFDVFPDARVVFTHRDPIMAQASVTNLLGTLFWMRSDQTFDAKAFDNLLTPESTAARLNNVIDQIGSGAVPRQQMFDFQYTGLIDQPLAAVQQLYQRAGLTLSPEALQNMEEYQRHKPKGKFGKHHYSVGEREQIARRRAHFQRYQQHYGVPDEN